jgi:hypothetical protein
MKKKIVFLTTTFILISLMGFSQRKLKMEQPIDKQEMVQTSNSQFTQRSSTQNESEGAKMTFQGSLFKNGEAFNGNAKLAFSVELDSSTSWTEIHESVTVINGLYSVVLGQFNPLPSTLFHNKKEQILSLEVDDVILGNVKLYAPLSSNKLEIPRRSFISNGDVSSDTLYHVKVDADNTVRGFQVDMNGTGLKFAIRGNNNSAADDPGFKIAVLGSSIGQGTGSHEGVRGQASANGRSNTGVLGLAVGQGSGDTGYESGSYNNGVTGQASNNAWGNTGVYGYVGGSVGVDNIGVAGISAVGDSANFEIENKGVLGRAEGPGINKAVWARAINGQENWAGWFEGDLYVSGKIISDHGISGKLPLDFAGENGNRSVMLSSEGATGNDGTFRLSDENGASRVTIFANKYYNVRDTVNSTDSTDVYEPVYTGAGGAWIAGANGSQSVFLSSDGPEYNNGYVDVSGSDGQTRARLGMNQSNNGFVGGHVALNNNTDGRNSILRSDQLYFYNDKGGYPGWFGTYGTSGFSQLIGYDSSNAVTGALLTGFFGNQNPRVWLEDANANMTSHLTIKDNAGQFILNGKEWTPNIQMGGKHWENSNLAYLRLLGEIQVQGDILADSTGALTDTTYYYPGLVSMEAQKWDNSESGLLNLTSTVADHGIRMYGGADFQSDGNVRSHLALDGPNGSYVYLWGHGEVNASGSMTAVSFDQTSDQRFKTQIKLIDGSLSKVKQLNGYTYLWNEKAKKEKGINDENEQIGVLAQEVEKLFPQLVSTDENGYKSVNYGSLTAVLIEAIKELSTEVATLKVENESLKSEMKTAASLENRLEKLELLLGLKSDVSSNAQNNK